MAEMSRVLLGVVDEMISTPGASFNVNKVGGLPDWTDCTMPKCCLCSKQQLLVTQVYCPLDHSPYHRVLYVFCCKETACWGRTEGWSVYRMTFADENAEHGGVQPTVKSTGGQWGEDDDDWGESPGDNSQVSNAGVGVGVDEDSEKGLNSVTDHFAKLEMADAGMTSASHSQGGFTSVNEPNTTFQSYCVNVFDEAECEKWAQLTERRKEARSEDAEEETAYVDFAEGCKLRPEAYEKTEVSCKTFHRFWKRSRICPEQVIRYSYNGDPLLARAVTKDVPRCQCGSKRIYEMQLMPALLPYLILGDTNIEFSTVLVYTCSKNCTVRNGLIIEHAIYQDDPDLSYFKGQKKR